MRQEIQLTGLGNSRIESKVKVDATVSLSTHQNILTPWQEWSCSCYLKHDLTLESFCFLKVVDFARGSTWTRPPFDL